MGLLFDVPWARREASPFRPQILDLQTGAAKARYQLPGDGAFCNDIAVERDGTVYVSDTENMQVDRLASGAQQLEVWAGNGGFGPKGGVLDGVSLIGSRLFVNALETNKLFAVPIQGDGKAGPITEIKLDRPIENPDGMRSFRRGGLLLVESGGKGRLSRITISGDSGQVTTLKEGYPQGPVSVAVLGSTAYVLEGQLDVLFGSSQGQGPTKPFHATSVEIIP